jgi:tripartite-type tricarboxylate transporter receptor subunit TctC
VRKEMLRRLSSIAPCLLVLSVVMLLFTGAACSEFPERQVSVMVGFGPGGTIDLLARGIAIGAGKYLKQPVVIENRGGGGGSVALGVVAAAKPDGYTLTAIQNASIVDTALMQKVPYKPLKSFTPLLAIAMSEHSATLVKADAPWKTFREFMDYAKANPGKIKYGTSGIGTGMHVVMEAIAKKDGIKWVHIPYKTAVDARTALLGGHIDAVSSGTDWPPFVQAGQLRVLFTHGEKRSPHFPDVPTIKELGYNYASDTLHCIVGPAGLPSEVASKLEAAFEKGMETPEYKAVMEKIYMSPAHLTGKDLDQSLKDRWTKTEKLFKEYGIIKEAATQPY